ncbi:hypothetical protein [Rhizobium sp. G21]|uniref:hypothetical protein n=1 Tax=Rhizobium sp. G21 TaxID=2758439 RepID=UPI001FF02988|nr:hypothetical protein [Rhizobium sp. G21]
MAGRLPIPAAAPVRSLKMMFPDGVIRTCSRSENADVFRHAMGGYGLFGVILELELDMVPNMRLEPRFEPVAGRQLGQRFAETLAADRSVEMAYGRLDVSIDNFFNDGLLITFRPTEDQSDLPAAEGSGIVSAISAKIFRMQTESERSKQFRWWTEETLGPSFTGVTTRNNLMNEPVITLDDGDPSRTDILHEYFVPPDRFADFVEACRAVIPASYQQLLNVTVRYVAADTESVLAYAPEPRIASVMVLAGNEPTRRGRHAAHDASADRARAGDRRLLLPAVPAACVARSADAKLSARRRLRRLQAQPRSPADLSQSDVGPLFQQAVRTP